MQGLLLTSLRLFEGTIIGCSKRRGLSAVVKHQRVSGTRFNNVHSKAGNTVLLLALSSLIMIIALLFDKVLESIISIVIFVDLILNDVHRLGLALSCSLLIWNILLCMLPNTLDKSGKVDIRIFRFCCILRDELYHIKVGVFIFEAQVPKERLNQDLVHRLISINEDALIFTAMPWLYSSMVKR